MKKTIYFLFLLVSVSFASCDDAPIDKIEYPTTFEYDKMELGKTHLYLLDGVGGYKELTTIPKHYLWAMDSIKKEANEEPDFIFEAKSITLKDDKNVSFKTFDDDEGTLPYTTKGNLFTATEDDSFLNFEYNSSAKTMSLLLNTHFSYSNKIKMFTAYSLSNGSGTGLETDVKAIVSSQKWLKNDTLCLNLGKVIYKQK